MTLSDPLTQSTVKRAWSVRAPTNANAEIDHRSDGTRCCCVRRKQGKKTATKPVLITSFPRISSKGIHGMGRWYLSHSWWTCDKVFYSFFFFNFSHVPPPLLRILCSPTELATKRITIHEKGMVWASFNSRPTRLYSFPFGVAMRNWNPQDPIPTDFFFCYENNT